MTPSGIEPATFRFVTQRLHHCATAVSECICSCLKPVLGYKSLILGRLQLKCDGTRWRTGEEVKEKLANGVGSQNSSHYLGTWCIQHYYRWCAHLGCQQSTELTPPADLKGLVRFAERRNLVSTRVPSHFNWPLPIIRIHYTGYTQKNGVVSKVNINLFFTLHGHNVHH